MITFHNRSMAPVLLLAITHATTLAGTPEVLVVSGDPTPGGESAFDTFSVPMANDAGQVAFNATTQDGGEGLFRIDPDGIVEIAVLGGASPDGNGVFGAFFSEVLMNNAGEIAFNDFLTGTLAGSGDDEGVFIGNGAALDVLAKDGDEIVALQSTITGLDSGSLNDAGQFAFRAFLSGAVSAAVMRADTTALVTLAVEGQPSPDGNGALDAFDDPALNAGGTAAFAASIAGSALGELEDSAVLLSDGTQTLIVAREGQPSPDGNGVFESFSRVALNDAGDVAFETSFRESQFGLGENRALIRRSGASLSVLVRESQPAPNQDGHFLRFDSPALNSAGVVAYHAILAGTNAGSATNTGIFVSDGQTTARVAREGTPTPIPGLVFRGFGFPAMNNSGHVAFLATHRNEAGESDGRGIYLSSGTQQLALLAATGDPLLGSVITDLSFRNGVINLSDEGSGLSEQGEVVFGFTLEDGRQGIARAIAACPGDCDGSGSVDFNDLVAMLFEFGQPASIECDTDGSGTVDFNDLVATLFVFGPCP